MQMTGEHRIPASREKVWAALNDPEILKACIPGCESLEKTSDTDMTAQVRMKIGPVSAKFSGKVTLSDIDPPNGYKISGEGQGGAAGFAKGGASVALKEDGAETVLTYTADAQVGGKIAQIGARLIDGTARKLADEFFGKFAEVVGGGPAASGAAAQDGEAAAGGPMSAEQAAAHNAKAAAESAKRGFNHWLTIGAGVLVLIIVWLSVR